MTQVLPVTQLTPKQNKPLYDREDLKLAASNATLLTALAVSSYISHPLLGIATAVATLWKEFQTWSIMPKSPSAKLITFPFTQGLGFVLPTVGKVWSAATLGGVALHSGSKFAQSVKALKNRPWEAVKAAILHAFNLGTEGYMTALRLTLWNQVEQAQNQYFESQQESQQSNSNTNNCPPKEAADFASMSPKERFTTPKLDPNCVGDAKIMMGLKQPTCQTVKIAYRVLSLGGVHPDKGGSEEAFINLQTAKKTLETDLFCY